MEEIVSIFEFINLYEDQWIKEKFRDYWGYSKFCETIPEIQGVLDWELQKKWVSDENTEVEDAERGIVDTRSV